MSQYEYAGRVCRKCGGWDASGSQVPHVCNPPAGEQVGDGRLIPYMRALQAALAEAGYPLAPVSVHDGLVTVGCIPHGADPAGNPRMPPEAVLDAAYALCRPLR